MSQHMVGGFENEETEHPGSVSSSPEVIGETNFATVKDSMESFSLKMREKGKSLADKWWVGWIPCAKPLINMGLEQQKAMYGLTKGVDIDTGAKLGTTRDRVLFTTRHMGRSMWESTKAGIDGALLIVGGSIAEKAATKIGGSLLAKGAAHIGIDAAKEVVTGTGDKLVDKVASLDPEYKAALALGGTKLATHMVDRLPGIYRSIAEGSKDKQMAEFASGAAGMLETINANPEAKQAMVQSLEESDVFQKQLEPQAKTITQDPNALAGMETQAGEWFADLMAKSSEQATGAAAQEQTVTAA